MEGLPDCKGLPQYSGGDVVEGLPEPEGLSLDVGGDPVEGLPELEGLPNWTGDLAVGPPR